MIRLNHLPRSLEIPSQLAKDRFDVKPAVEMTDELRSVIHKNVADALAEDIGGGDLTSALVDEDAVVGATVIARDSLLLAGQPWADAVFA